MWSRLITVILAAEFLMLSQSIEPKSTKKYSVTGNSQLDDFHNEWTDGTIRNKQHYFIDIFEDLKGKISLPLATNDTELLEEIMNFLTWGEAEIKMAEQADTTLIVGMTGSGKSTTALLMAGEEEQLEAVEGPNGFYIVDKNGLINPPSIISATLLPNLLIDNETDTALYDCPGFSDTRNISVEIANTFFIKKVADHRDSVKIVVVVHHDTLKASNRNAFPELLNHLIVFIQNIEKFVNGVALISTQNNDRFSENTTRTLLGYLTFFEGVKQDLPNLGWEGHKLEAALSLINIFLEKDKNNFPINLGSFPTPIEAGPLFDDPLINYTEIKRFLRNLVWNNTDYVTKAKKDIGYSLSSEAKFFLIMLVSSIDERITEIVTELSSTLVPHFERRMYDLIFGVDLIRINATLDALFTASYNTTNFDDLSPSVYMDEIVGNILKFSEGTVNNSIVELRTNFAYLEFLKEATSSETLFDIHPKQWVSPLIQLKQSVEDIIRYHTLIVNDNVFTSLRDVSLSIKRGLASQINSLTDRYEKTERLERLRDKIDEDGGLLLDQLSNEETIFQNFLRFYIERFTNLEIDLSTEPYESVLVQISILDVIHGLPINNMEWKATNDWKIPLEIISGQVEDEITWYSKFLLILLEELSDVNVQVEDPKNYMAWWSNKNITMNNWQEFLTKFSDTRAVQSTQNSNLTEIVEYSPEKLILLNELLNLTLLSESSFSCQGPDSLGVSIYRGTFFRMDKIYNCSRSSSRKIKRIVVLALHTIFFASEFSGSNINVDFVDVFLMSPNWNFGRGSSLNLNGAAGEPSAKPSGKGSLKGIPGKPGKNGGNFFGIGKNFDGNATVHVNGGKGGAGQEGQNAMDGETGTKKDFECHGGWEWYGASQRYWFSISVFPHTCDNRNITGSTRCYTNSVVQVFGNSNGTPGKNGNDGGVGGKGGNPGKYLLVKVDEDRETEIYGKVGLVGQNGKSGQPGLGGLDGPTENYQISGTDTGCYRRFNSTVNSTLRANPGSAGVDGGNSQGIILPQTNYFEPKEFFLYVVVYKSDAVRFLHNEFFRKSMTAFLSKVEAHRALQ